MAATQQQQQQYKPQQPNQSFPPRRCSLPQEPRQRLPSVPILPRAPNAAKGGSTYDLWRITRHSCQVMQVLNGGKEENMLKRLLVTNMLQKVYRISQDMIKQNKRNRVEKTDHGSRRSAPPTPDHRRASTPIIQATPGGANSRQLLAKGNSCPALKPTNSSRQLRPNPVKRTSVSLDAPKTKAKTVPDAASAASEENARRKGRKLRTAIKGLFSSKKAPTRHVESMA
eukprot:m.258938 g.258938  ORF g.258938 m.258938 type:complete len:227 (+) comp37349_c0_seq1:323-1003(+)